MSRIGKMAVPLPASVKVSREGDLLLVQGPKGTNVERIHPNMKVEIGEKQIVVRSPDDSKFNRSLHGLTRALISNAVVGASQGFTRTLEIEGVGFKASMSSQTKNGLTLELGFSHKIEVAPPEGVTFSVPNQTQIVVSGANKQMVGEIAAKIRMFRPPEPYKGKGIHYQGEHIRRKAGKTGSTTA